MSDSSQNTRVTLLIRIATSAVEPEVANDSPAWNEFVNLYSPMVRAWCRQLGLSDADASDATQEVMVKLLRIMKEFEYDSTRGSFRSWLKTVTSNLVRDLQRAAKPGDYGTGDSNIQHVLAQVTDPNAFNNLSQMLQRQYEQELVELAGQRVRERVSEKNWDAYRMYAVDQRPAGEVAKELQIPIAEVYVAKSRITKMMRDVIGELE